MLDGRNGPFMPIGTKGGEPPFAAVCTKVSYARRFQLVDATL
jgi:hypothetical protein